MIFLENLRIKGGEIQCPLSFFEIKGPDAYSYLSGQTTNLVKKEVGEGSVNAFLTIKGSLICHFFLYKSEENSYLAVVESTKEKDFYERLESFHISEEFDVQKLEKKYRVLIGEDNIHQEEGIPFWFYGIPSKILFDNEDQVATLSSEDLSILKAFYGFHEKYQPKLFTESRVSDFAYDPHKGCFPGQETVAKIKSRRGAAYFPVLLKSESELSLGELKKNEKVVGEVFESFKIEDQFYAFAKLLRTERVEGKSLDGATVKMFPFLEESKEAWAQKICDEGLNSFLSEKSSEKAKKLLTYAINWNPFLGDAYESLGVILGREENYLEAIELMKKLQKVDSSSIMAHTNLSLYYMKIGEIEKAENEKSKAMLKEFERAGSEENKEELAKKEIEELSRKEEMFKQVLEIDEEDQIALFGLGEINFIREDYVAAKEFFEASRRKEPKHSKTYLLLAKTLIKLKDKKEAKKILEQGIEVAASQGDMMPANEMQATLNEFNN